MFLVIKPTDEALVRFFGGFGLFGGPPFAILFAALAVLFFPPAGVCPHNANSTALQIAGGHSLCWQASIVCCQWAVTFGIATVVMVPMMRRHDHAVPMAKSITSYVAEHRRKHGLLVTLLVGAVLVLTNTQGAVVGFWAVREHEKGHFVLPVRLALRRMWFAVRLGTTRLIDNVILE